MYNIIYTPQQRCIRSLKPVLRGDFFQWGGGKSSYNQGIRGGKGVVGSRYFGEESHFLFNTKLKWPWKLWKSCFFLLVFEKCWRTPRVESSNGTGKNVLQSTAHCTGLKVKVSWTAFVTPSESSDSGATFQSASPQNINPLTSQTVQHPQVDSKDQAVSQNSL